ncbi:MAG: SIMPL domain-containing protein [Acidobacteriota bacterium]|nr:SIMPL domain-containing protein [Acidobacteriota bacterium]
MRRHIMMLAFVGASLFLFAAPARALTAAEEITVRGRLGKTVEAGGWLILAEKQKYLILNAERWRGETWFREAAEVEATGEVKSDVITTYQEGTPFQANSLRPRGNSGGSGDGAGVTGSGGPAVSGMMRVVVSGDALVQAQPDTAVAQIAAVTQAKTALEAQQENARKSDAVVRAVKQAAGAGAEVKTSGYSLQPQYAYREGQPPLIRGYEARNTITVTLADLTKVGQTIDAASAAGATNVDSLSFTLRRDRPARDQALGDATREALGKAQVIAAALGGRVVRIAEVVESDTMVRPPVPLYREASRGMLAQADAPPTPIEPGTLDIRAQVQLVAEVMTGQ